MKKRIISLGLIFSGGFCFFNTLYNQEISTHSIELLNDTNSYYEESPIAACAFSGDGNYLAVGGVSDYNAPIEIYEWNHTNKTLTLRNVALLSLKYEDEDDNKNIQTRASSAANWYSGSTISTMDWNGNLLAVGGWGGVIEVYQWDGVSDLALLDNSQSYSCDGSTDIYTLAWNSNGDYLAVGGSKGCIFIYSWDGSVLTYKDKISSSKTFGFIFSLDWNGNYLAAGGWDFSFGQNDSDYINILEFGQDEELSLKTSTTYNGGLHPVFSLAWRGNDLAVGGNSGIIETYRWDSSIPSLTLTNSANSYSENNINSIAWEGNYLVVGGGTSGRIELYNWDSTSSLLTLVNNVHSYDGGSHIRSLDSGPIVVGGEDGKIEIYGQE